MQTGAAPGETSMEGPQKIKIELPCDPAIPLLGIYPKTMKPRLEKLYAALSVLTAALRTTAQV